MAARRTMSDYQQAGSGGIIFMGFLQAITLPLSYEQRRMSYRGIYSLIVAKVYEDKKLIEIEGVTDLIHQVKGLLDQAGEDYDPKYESHSTFSKDENKYVELLAQIFDKLSEIVTKTKLIEKITQEQEIFA